MFPNSTDPILIHQTLHGYSDGHRLLAASAKLSKETLRTMLVLSDMSGPSMIKGFEEYLTAYTLSNDGFLALAKTWHAPEMKRAGCVWTHTLLIPAASLRFIASPTSILPLLRKPSSTELASSYGEGIRLVPDQDAPAIVPPSHAAIAPSLMAALYGSESPVVMVADNSQEFESLMLATWAQLWPLNLPDCRFCTGSIRFRDLGGRPFDLQLIPPGALREAERRFSGCTVVESPGSAPPTALPEWVLATTQDLLSDCCSDFRQFLWQLAANSGEGRTALRRYLSVFDFLKNPELSEPRLGELVSLVARNFPTSSQACPLKCGLFGGPSQRTKFQDKDDYVFLKAITTTNDHSAYDPDSLAITPRIASIWRTDSDRILRELLPSFHLPLAPIQEACSVAVIDNAENDQLCPILSQFPDIFLPLIAKRPQILTSPSLWHCPADLQERLVDLVAASGISSEVSQGMLLAQLAVPSDAVADKMAAWLGEDAAFTVLNWVVSASVDEPRTIPRRWRQLLAEQPTSIIQWLTDHPQSPLLCLLPALYLLDPNCRVVRDTSIDIWMAFADRALEDPQNASTIELMAFLLVVALRSRDESSPLLVTRSFPTVYEAARANALSQGTIMILQSEFSGINWQWDKCRRLRRALVEIFTDRSWPSECFLHCTQDTTLLSAIYDTWGWGRAEVRFLRQIIQDVNGGTAQATDDQLDVLMRHTKWFR